MSNITDVFFFLSFVSLMALFVYKLFNLLSGLDKYDLRGVFLTFIGTLTLWFFTLVSFLSSPEEKVFIMLFRFGNLILIINVMFCIVELLFNLSKIGVNPKRAARFSNREV